MTIELRLHGIDDFRMPMTEQKHAVAAAIQVGFALLVKDEASLRTNFQRQVGQSRQLGQAAVDVPLIVLQHDLSKFCGS